jgi:hypothetical protein
LRAGIERERLWAPVFVIPRRKTSLVEALYGRAAMAGVGALWSTMGNSPERGERGTGGGEGGWGTMGRGCYGGARWLLLYLCCSCAARAFCTWEKARRREEKGEEKEKEKEEKEKKQKKKYEKISKLKIFKKIKDNLWSWSKIIFVQERNKLNYN